MKLCADDIEIVREVIRFARQAENERKKGNQILPLECPSIEIGSRWVNEMPLDKQAMLFAVMSYGRGDVADEPKQFGAVVDQCRGEIPAWGIGNYLFGKAPLADYLFDGMEILSGVNANLAN